jgi:CRISPR-associated protein Cas5t
MLILRVCAPFATFRSFVAGSYRPSAPFVTPSAAYGLLLNIAGRDTRLDDGKSSMTLTRPVLPPARIAIGVLARPGYQSLYQQLHNYPVGNTGKEREPDAHGNKYNIQPVRRELLSDIDALIAIDGNADLEEEIRSGLSLGSRHAPHGRRYGLPFLGDNNFLLSHLEETVIPLPAWWYIHAGDEVRLDQNPARLTIWVDRAGMANTVTRTYILDTEQRTEPPEFAWTRVPPNQKASRERQATP